MNSHKLTIVSLSFFLASKLAFGLDSPPPLPSDNTLKTLNQASLQTQKASNLVDQGKEIGSLQKNEFGEVSRPFCTIYASSYQWWYLTVTIWKDAETAGCQLESFAKLSAGSIKEQMRTLVNPPNEVKKGGINISTMDLKISSSLTPYHYIGNIKMHPDAEIRISLFDILKNPNLIRLTEPFGGAYLPIPVREISYLRWDPGTQIRYIETDKKEKFVMTSFNTRIYPTLNASDLNNLGAYLNLPEGWSYKIGKLDKILEYKSSEGYSNIRMLDQFSNFYIKLDPQSAL